jgi:hypothetical protein
MNNYSSVLNLTFATTKADSECLNPFRCGNRFRQPLSHLTLSTFFFSDLGRAYEHGLTRLLPREFPLSLDAHPFLFERSWPSLFQVMNFPVDRIYSTHSGRRNQHVQKFIS